MFLGIGINATSIADAWFRLLYEVLPEAGASYRQEIQKGSFEGEQCRFQFPAAAILIQYPQVDIVPVIPDGLGIPAPTTMEYIEDYFANYLMDPTLGENETYKYASRIHAPMDKGGTQLSRVMNVLKHTPLTNQAIIEIGSPTDYDTCVGNDGKLEPPCLRLLDFKVLPHPDGKLYLSVTCYFRSWDLWAGFPTNLGGIELLKQFVAMQAGLENGPMYAYSAGLHVYGHHEEIVRLRTRREKATEGGE